MATIHQAFDKWLSMPSMEAVDVLAATVIGNRLEGPPIYMVLVGPSGSGKSELIEALGGLRDVKSLGKFTPRTLVSGYRTGNGVLERLPKGRPTMFTIKDLTTILSSHHNDRDQIMAQLREIYDGRFDADWGTGKRFTWQGKIGIIAGCTKVYDEVAAKLTGLGERFLAYKPESSDSIIVAERAMRGAVDDKVLKRELKAAFKTLDQISIPADVPIERQVRVYLAGLCQYLALLRAPVPRNRNGAVCGMPSPEGTGRIAKQFAQLAKGLAVVRGVAEPGEDEVVTVESVAFSSLPNERREALTALPWEGAPIRRVADFIGMPSSVVHRTLEDLAILGVAQLFDPPRGPYAPNPKYAAYTNAMKRMTAR